MVRFSNRNVKEAIFKAKHLLPKNLSITEHLTESTLSILKKAQELFGYGYARTKNCKVFVDVFGKSIKVSNIDDVHKLFVEFCEFIGSNDYRQPAPSCTNTIRCKFFDPDYAAVLEMKNPTTNKYSNRTYYRHRRGYGRW